MSFDQYDYPALSRTPLFRYGYGQGGGLRKTNVLADMLNGLANGVQNFQAARQQSAQQDQANQSQALQRQLLQGQIDHQGLVNDQLRQNSGLAQSAPAVEAMRHALRRLMAGAGPAGEERARRGPGEFGEPGEGDPGE